MKRFLAALLFLSLPLLAAIPVLTVPAPASAAGLIFCGRSADDPTTSSVVESDPCTACHIVLTGQGVMDWLMRIMTVVAITIITAMGIMYIVSAGNPGMTKTAKEGIKASLIGFALMLGAWLIVNTVLVVLANNAPGGPLSGLVNNGAFNFSCNTASSAASSVLTPGSSGSGGSSTPSASCEDPTALKDRLKAGGSVCNQSCSSSNNGGCKGTVGNKYGAIIRKYYPENPNIISALICRESGGNEAAHSFDGGCGLMQITNSSWTGSCPSTILNPDENIKQGVALFKQKLSAVQSKSYGGVTKEQMAYAAYNCCSNGENPNDPSADCKQSDGWPALPKWACPINPGTGQFNMCDVKGYACDVSACVAS